MEKVTQGSSGIHPTKFVIYVPQPLKLVNTMVPEAAALMQCYNKNLDLTQLRSHYF